jgi:hypothetical protein
VELHLIQPGGIYRRVDEHGPAKGPSELLCRRRRAVRAAIVRDSQDPAG